MNDEVFEQGSVRLIRRIVQDEIGEALDEYRENYRHEKKRHSKNFAPWTTPRESDCFCPRQGQRIIVVDNTCLALDRGQSCGGCDFDRNRIITRLAYLLASDLRGF